MNQSRKEMASSDAHESAARSVKLPIVRSQFSPRTKVQLVCTEPGLTQQHFKEEVDVNNILKKYLQTGQLPIGKKQAEFGYATSQSFTESMFIVASAKEEFAKLPSEVRTHFNNDPAQYLDAALDPSKRSLFEKFGIVDPLPSETTEAPSEPATETPVTAEIAPTSS